MKLLQLEKKLEKKDRMFRFFKPGACVIKLITAVIYLDSMVKP